MRVRKMSVGFLAMSLLLTTASVVLTNDPASASSPMGTGTITCQYLQGSVTFQHPVNPGFSDYKGNVVLQGEECTGGSPTQSSVNAVGTVKIGSFCNSPSVFSATVALTAHLGGVKVSHFKGTGTGSNQSPDLDVVNLTGKVKGSYPGTVSIDMAWNIPFSECDSGGVATVGIASVVNPAMTW